MFSCGWRVSVAVVVKVEGPSCPVAEICPILGCVGFEEPTATMLRVGGVRLPLVRRIPSAHAPGVARLLSTESDKSARPETGRTSQADTPSSQRPDPPYTSSVSEAAVAANAEPLPFLSQPLGVPKRPTSENPTWGEKHAEWFNRDARLAKRRMMCVRHTHTQHQGSDAWLLSRFPRDSVPRWQDLAESQHNDSGGRACRILTPEISVLPGYRRHMSCGQEQKTHGRHAV